MVKTNPDCVFCKIIQGIITTDKYYEDEKFLAIFDVYPISKGHLVVFSKNHYENISEMPEKEWQELCVLVRQLAEKHLFEIKVDGYNILINQGKAAESGVPHRPHFHIIPRRFGDGIKIDPR